ncbi:unnamed protein product [Lymnaea stagnalis]|uniref:Uncharacterized protein n=1 Tax=Lymnaea stagnalis TaxID=6523 RepID=A0AAV2HYS1_LYMST
MKAPLKPRRRATKVLNGSIGRKTTIKVTPTAARGKLRNGGVARKFEVQPSPGFPWRTAARANRFRGHPPDKSRFLSSPDVSTSLLFTNTNKNNDGGSGSDREAVVVKSGPSPMKHTEPDSGVALKKLEESHMSLDLTNQKEVLIELEQMRRRLREERLSRAKADQQIVQLMLENHRLEGMLEKLEKGRSPSRRILEDEKFLESIETSFKQFHAFIDMLKEAGLGQLVSMAGLDQSQMPFGNSSSVKNHYENLPEPGMVHISRLTYDGKAQTNGQRTGIVTSVPTHQGSNVYSDEGELARQEADELYTKLVRETQSAIKDTAPRDTTWMRSSVVAKSGVGRSEPGDAHFQNHGDQGVDSRQEHRGQSRIDESINFSVGESRDNESANLSVEQSSYGGEERHSVVDKDDSADDEDF